MALANEISFGVEIETHMPVGATPVGPYHRGVQCSFLPEGWRAERDGSIKIIRGGVLTSDYQGTGRQPVEFVSPRLRGAEGLRQVREAVAAIKTMGARINQSCGVHVTVEFNGDTRALVRLLSLVANHEQGLFAATGTRNRERSGYCKPTKVYRDADHARRNMARDRYHAVNITHLVHGRNRVEFRLFSASVNPLKIVAWVQLCLGLVEMALEAKRTTSWTDKSSGAACWNRREGKGERELVRLFYRLGWTKGHTARAFGVVAGEGLPTVAQLKAELERLAKAYDRA